jgi:hypothetical protein
LFDVPAVWQYASIPFESDASYPREVISRHWKGWSCPRCLLPKGSSAFTITRLLLFFVCPIQAGLPIRFHRVVAVVKEILPDQCLGAILDSQLPLSTF